MEYTNIINYAENGSAIFSCIPILYGLDFKDMKTGAAFCQK